MPRRIFVFGTTILIPVLACAVGLAFPAAAQQTRQQRPPPTYQQDVAQPTQDDQLRSLATNLNERRSELFRQKDVARAAAMYTPDAVYIELLPKLDIMMGRAQIEQHLRDLITSNARELVLTVTSAKMDINGELMVGGDYYVNVQSNKRINGHFFQVLRRDGGAWKIAMHTFARPEPVTPVEASEYNVGG
jgi:ketosteroid isomerase-like protein